MPIDRLLQWLKTLNIDIAADATHPDGRRVVTVTAQLPFPSTRRVWYPVVLSKGQTNVANEEIEALLRHCWHAEQEVPKFPAGAAAGKSNGPTKAAMNTVKRVRASEENPG
jgi:hypothetical protein